MHIEDINQVLTLNFTQVLKGPPYGRFPGREVNHLSANPLTRTTPEWYEFHQLNMRRYRNNKFDVQFTIEPYGIDHFRAVQLANITVVREYSFSFKIET